MSSLILVDLRAQYNHVQAFVAGMSENEILQWMRNYGVVTKITNPYDDKIYSFRSNSGIRTGFRFDENGKIIVFNYIT